MCPPVSVLLPVYNGAAYLHEAIQSILDQTYDNFEFIIIDDGSEDESASIIQTFKDPRIRFYEQTNQGLAATLNRAVELAGGEYLARQDADDISFPQRLKKQVAFLEAHPDYGMVGTWAVIWEETRETKRFHKHPAESSILKFDLLFDNPFVHSSVMIRKTVFERVGLYSTQEERQPEDYELWSRVAREFEVANIPEILQVYREVKGSICRAEENPFLAGVVNLSIENLALFLGAPETDRRIINLAALVHGADDRLASPPSLRKTVNFLYSVADKMSDSLNIERGILRNRALTYFQMIRKYYLRYRYGKNLGRFMNRILSGLILK